MILLLGVDIGGTDIKLGIVTADGDILERGEMPTCPGEGPGASVERVKRWMEKRAGEHGSVLAAGIGCAGLVDAVSGLLHSSPNLKAWEMIPLKRLFEEALSLPVVVENDVNCAAYAEHRKGSGRGTKHFVCITLGTGVGGGIVVGGKLNRGFSGFAGEVGHMVIDINGPLCSCGKRGCLESYVKAQAIVDRVSDIIRSGRSSKLSLTDPLTVADISRAASDGDEVAREVLGSTGRYLGIGLANLVHLLDPEVIAIGGGVAGAGDLILEPARSAFKKRVMDEALAGVEIVPAALGNDASFLGAALIAAGEGIP